MVSASQIDVEADIEEYYKTWLLANTKRSTIDERTPITPVVELETKRQSSGESLKKDLRYERPLTKSI